MKKLLFLLCAITLSVYSNAQGLGDYMEIDGVPGFVFYVDDSEEHGLVMSFPQMSKKKIDKYVKKGLIPKEKAEKLCAIENKSRISKNEWKDIKSEIIKFLSDDGEQNQIAIIDYCNQKNIPLSIFPMQEWAASLGDNWFIPGDKELTLFAEFYVGGLGRSYGLGSTFYSRCKELSNDPLVQGEIMLICLYGVYSSTIKHADCGFRSLRQQVVGFPKIINWFEIFDTWSGKAPNTCAVHKF